MIHQSLVAADLNVVMLGDGQVGFTHPNKAFGAMFLARPFLYVGPRPSYVTDLMEACPGNLWAPHGDPAALVEALRQSNAARSLGHDRSTQCSVCALKFDVVVDTAPINAVADTISLLPNAQVVLMVVRSGRTAERVIQRAITEIHRAGSRIAGLVLNQLPKRGGSGYYYYYTARTATARPGFTERPKRMEPVPGRRGQRTGIERATQASSLRSPIFTQRLSILLRRGVCPE